MDTAILVKATLPQIESSIRELRDAIRAEQYGLAVAIAGKLHSETAVLSTAASMLDKPRTLAEAKPTAAENTAREFTPTQLHGARLLDIKDLVERLKFSRAKIYKMIALDEFPVGVKIGKARRWGKDIVEDWMRVNLAQ